MSLVPRRPSLVFALVGVSLLARTETAASQGVLVDFGERWRFFRGTRAPSEEEGAWRFHSFDDSEWEEGPLGIGYGDGDDATVLEDMRDNYTSVFLRRRFDAPGHGAFGILVLSVDFDDAFVCFLNGTEVARANVFGDSELNAVATSVHEAGVPETFDISGAIPVLRETGNILAVHALNASAGSSDFSFNASLTTDGPIDPPPMPASVLFRLEGGEASAGGRVAVPLAIRAEVGASGFDFSVDFDEEVLAAAGVAPVWGKPDGTPYAFELYEVDNQNVTPGSGGIDEGYVVGVVLFSETEPLDVLPPLEEQRVVEIEFSVDGAASGRTEVAFVDGGQGSFGPIGNRLLVGRSALTPATARFSFDSARIEIVQAGTFIRGDANGDASVDITDPVATLNHLFQGGEAPACLDAADADDDGALTITDPIATLDFLFRGGDPLPPPNDTAGTDPTEDALGCGA